MEWDALEMESGSFSVIFCWLLSYVSITGDKILMYLDIEPLSGVARGGFGGFKPPPPIEKCHKNFRR